MHARSSESEPDSLELVAAKQELTVLLEEKAHFASNNKFQSDLTHSERC
jgi:hypothetical protein